MVQSIDQFKSLISAKDGVARPNLYRIKFPSMPGATAEAHCHLGRGPWIRTR